MKTTLRFSSGILLVLFLGFFSCAGPSSGELAILPYFDLKGFIETKIKDIDGAEVLKVSRIQGKEVKKTVVYSIEDWKEELDVFIQADINKASLVNSYDTRIEKGILIHELLPDADGKVKYIKVDSTTKEVRSISIKMSEDNLFYSSMTLAELYLNSATFKIDHYSIETTQKIWFLAPNNMKITGVVKPKR